MTQKHEQKISLDADSVVFIITMYAIPVTHGFLLSDMGILTRKVRARGGSRIIMLTVYGLMPVWKQARPVAPV
jgi:hypothetical protein